MKREIVDHPLRRWRLANKVGQGEFAASVGVAPSHISQIETGTKGASLPLAKKIQEATGNMVAATTLIRAEPKQGVAA